MINGVSDEPALNVLLNAVMLRDALTGIGHYTQRLAMGLEAHPRVDRVLYFERFDLTNRRPHYMGQSAWWKSRIRRIRLVADAYHHLRRMSFRIRSARSSATIYHEPNYLLMPFDGLSVATIHDLSYLHYPQYHPRERIRRMERGMPETLRRATHLLTVSEFVRREVIEILGVPRERITVVAPGVDGSFRPRTREECAAALARFGLGDAEYLLAVGTLEPRKNVGGLLAAYARLPARFQEAHPLVLVGMKGWLTDSLERTLEPLVRQGRVRRLGYVDSDDLPLLYAAARAFAFPSFYEGFGFPPLEAMACGVPVLISDRASLPEVTGGVALQVDPEDVDAMASGLERLLTDDDFRARAAQAGPKRAAEFTWGRCADRTVDVYRRVLAEGAR